MPSWMAGLGSPDGGADVGRHEDGTAYLTILLTESFDGFSAVPDACWG